MDEWMTVEEAANHFGVSESYIRSHIRKGDFNSNVYGYPLRLKSSEVDVFLLPFKLD
jgi:excisionase family DNA binding protein